MRPKKKVSVKKSTEETVDEPYKSDMLLTELATSPSPDTAAVLAAIGQMSQKMDDRFNSLDASLKVNQAMLAEHESRLSAVENASSDHDGRLAKLEQPVRQLEAANKALRDKAIDPEARSIQTPKHKDNRFA